LSADYPNKLTLGSEVSDREIRGARVMYVRRNLIGIKSRVKFCENSTDIPSASLKTWENGYFGGLTESGAEKVAEYIKTFNIYCSPTWLLYGIGEPPQVMADDFIQPNEEHAKQIAQEILLFHQQNNAVESIVTDETMIPLLYPSYYVGGIIAENIDRIINQNCIVTDINDHEYIRRLTYGNKPGEYNLICLNPNTEKENLKNVKIKQAARIVLIRDPAPLN